MAEDVLQDAFIKIWLTLPSYDSGKAALYTWMASICTNMAIDYLRSKNYRNRCNTDELEIMMEAIDGQLQLVPYPDTMDVIRQVSALGKPYADVLMLFYKSGYTHVEISVILDLPLGTVKSRIRIAIRDLRTQYER